MKTKLLRRLRKNYRIVENGLGEQKIQIRDIFNYWRGLVLTERLTLLRYRKKDPSCNEEYRIHDDLLILFHYAYGNYTLKHRVETYKKKQQKVIWHIN